MFCSTQTTEPTVEEEEKKQQPPPTFHPDAPLGHSRQEVRASLIIVITGLTCATLGVVDIVVGGSGDGGDNSRAPLGHSTRFLCLMLRRQIFPAVGSVDIDVVCWGLGNSNLGNHPQLI